jgi:hypothetical protein
MAPSTLVDSADNEPRETATWTRYLPEAFGIREVVRKSPYRWCTRERCVAGLPCGLFLLFNLLSHSCL